MKFSMLVESANRVKEIFGYLLSKARCDSNELQSRAVPAAHYQPLSH